MVLGVLLGRPATAAVGAVLLLLLITAVQGDEPTITTSDTAMEFKIGSAKMTIESTECVSSVPMPLPATQSSVLASAAALTTTLLNTIATSASGTVATVTSSLAAVQTSTSTLAAQQADTQAYVSGLRAAAGLALENLATTSAVTATSSSLADRMNATAQAQTATASRVAASVTAGNALVAAGANAPAAAAGAYLASLKAATGATFATLVTQATMDTAVQSIRTARATQFTAAATAAVSAATSAVVSQGAVFATAARQAGQVVALASTILAKTGTTMQNLPGATYASTTLNAAQASLSTAVQAQGSAAAQLTNSLIASAVNATITANNAVAQGLAYVAAYRTTAGGALQNVATTAVLSNQISSLTAEVSGRVLAQQAAAVVAATSTIAVALNSLTPLVNGQGARVSLGETRVTNLTTVTAANSQSVRLNTADISNGRDAINSFSSKLTLLTNTRTTTSVNSSTFLSGVSQQLSNEITRALSSESLIATTETQLSTLLIAAPINGITSCQNQGLVVTASGTCVDLTLANCNANTATRVRLIGSVVEYCDGTAWIGILNTLGLTPPQVASSCQAVYTAQGANPKSGVYYIGTAASYQNVYCQMRTDGGWAMIAMMSDVDDETWQYASPVWTNTQLINPDVGDPMSDLHMKHPFYLTRSFTKIRFFLSSIDTFPFTVVTTQSSAVSMFASVTNLIGSGAAPTRGNFQNSFNNPRALEAQANCNQWGINTAVTNGGARFGMMFNEQGDCGSCDSGIGLGVYIGNQLAPASGYGRVGSGVIYTSPNTHVSRRGWIFIQ